MSTVVDATTDAAPLAAAAIRRDCTHCGLSTHLPPDASGHVFCCGGCRGAYDLIHAWGLDAYYDLRDGVTEQSPVSGAVTSYDDLDDPRLLGRSAPHVVQTGPEQTLLRCRLSVVGLHCAACVWLIEQTPRRVDGWHQSTVDYHRRTIDLVYDPNVTPLSQIGRCLHRLGYQVSPLGEPSLDDDGDADNRAMLIDIAVAGFCAANAMWVAIALYAGQFTGIDPDHAGVLRLAGVVLGGIAVVVPGRVFFRSAAASLWSRTPHMDLPVAVGLAAGLIASVFGLLDADREIYFDSIAGLVFFLLTGRWIQSRQQRRAGDAVAELIGLSPRAASRRDAAGTDAAGTWHRVAVESLRVGDHVRVGSGESVPVDGIVIEGRSLIDRSLLTGESVPVPVAVDAVVEAGTDNVESEIVVQATAVGDQTRLAELRNAVAGAAAARTPVVQLANRIGGWFVVIVLVLAAVTAAAWSWIDPSRAVGNSVALLIVACPCALALATPLAIAVTIGRLARRRVLIRSGDCLERLTRPGVIFFDKTGTLTQGKMGVTVFVGDASVLPAMAAIEQSVRHPIATAIVSYAAASANTPIEETTLDAVDIQHVPGRGVFGTIHGVGYGIGNLTLCNADDIFSGRTVGQWADQMRQTGASPICVTRDKTVVAMIGVSDPVRPDARAVLDRLRRDGWVVRVLSGDDPATVTRVGRSLGIADVNLAGGLLPQEKWAAVDAVMKRDAATRGPVVMVGDGLNDAAALAAADVGVALRGGAAASLAAAPVMIADGQLARVVTLVGAAGSMRRSIRRNFVVSISYNALAATLSIAGMISPLIAAALMPISSITVIAMTLASRTFADDAP